MGLPAEKEEDYRAPPANEEAEQALLGAIFVNNASYHRVADFLKPEHFSSPVHQRIYEAAGKLIEAGHKADPVTLRLMFDQDPALQKMGGATYLARLAMGVVTVLNAADYGRTIHDLFLRRQLITVAADLSDGAYSGDIERPATTLISDTEEALYNLAENGAAHSGGFRPIGDLSRIALANAEEALKYRGRVRGTPTGLTDLDRLIGGLMPGDFVVIGGRPSMGKTLLVEAIAKNAARYFQREHGAQVAPPRAVAFFSLEMTAEKIAARELAEGSGVSTDRQRKGDLTQQDFEEMMAASDRLASLPYFVDDTPRLSAAQIRHRARHLARRHGLGLIVVDHLQKMRQGGKVENRRLEIGDITNALAALAKELNVPLILLSQLSRAVEGREDKRPTLADLRESGDIEQDADIVLFLYRHEYYLSREEPARRPEESDEKYNDRYDRWKQAFEACHNVTQIIAAKNRDGVIGKVEVIFNAERSRFENLQREDSLL